MDRSTLLKMLGVLIAVLLALLGTLGFEMIQVIGRNSDSIHRIEGRQNEIGLIQKKFMDVWFKSMAPKPPGDQHPE